LRAIPARLIPQSVSTLVFSPVCCGAGFMRFIHCIMTATGIVLRFEALDLFLSNMAFAKPLVAARGQFR